ncbi:MAG: hypothetical protein ACOVMM_11320, partial [Chitinophagaceae bacterium]
HIVEAFNEIDFWKISSYPRNVFLDKNGKVVKITESIPSTKNGDVYQFDKSSFVKMLNELL